MIIPVEVTLYSLTTGGISGPWYSCIINFNVINLIFEIRLRRYRLLFREETSPVFNFPLTFVETVTPVFNT